jgi:enediyne biosynthesis protein E4
MKRRLILLAAAVTGAGLLRSWTSDRPHYADAASRSAFAYITNNDFRGRKYFQQPMCGGVGILDFDNDGQMDIFFSNGAQLPELKKSDATFYNCLLRNKGDGTFEDVTTAAGVAGEHLGYSYGVAAGDYDNDGYPDIFLANTGRNALYHNNRNGTFTDVTEQSGLGTKPSKTLSVQGAWFDYDNDGLLDLVVSNYTLWTPQDDQRCELRGMESYCHPRTYPAVPSRLYRNLGSGKFADVTEASGLGQVSGKGMGIAIADFNNDGWMDVFIANDTVRNFLFLNQKNGTFKEVALEFGVAYDDHGATVSGMGADAKDYDNDGFDDIFYNDLMGQGWALFHNQRGRIFRYSAPATKVIQLSQPYSGWGAGFIDYNNDGWKDIFSANGDVDNLTPNSPQHDTMFENVGGKEFVDVSQSMGADFLRVGYQRGSAFADLNNDGFMDIVVTSLNKKPRILLNSAENGNHWLLIKLIGRKSNRDAIGARVKAITAADRTLYNHATGSVGFLSTSDLRLHFGLGKETLVKTIEIHWPSGRLQTVHNTAADKILRIEEPE